MQDVSIADVSVHRLLSSTPPNRHSSLYSIPADVFKEIGSHLTTLSDILHFSLASSDVYWKLIPAVYSIVELRGPAQCEATLGMLQRCPKIARHVQKLVVRPEEQRFKRRQQLRAWDNAGTVSRLVSLAARHLDALQTFEWDGDDMLPDDRMWSTLQECCPYLRNIGTTFGCFLPRPSSHLFEFNDLAGFSLFFKDGFYHSQLHIPSRESEPVFSRIRDMLVNRCPNLESLTVAGTSAEPLDILRLLISYWPRLCSLTIGEPTSEIPAPVNPALVHPFLRFLERHPTLEGLHILSHSNVHSVDLGELDRDALPVLKEYSGSLEHLRALIDRDQDGAANVNANANLPWAAQAQHAPSSSPLSRTLQSVRLLEPMQLREFTPLTISRVLMDLPALTSLKITFALHSGYDSNGVFRTIISSCPQLLHLDLTCTSKPSFYLDSFSRSLSKLAKLRTLQLSIVKFHGEEPMHAGAARIALTNPRLSRFTINYIPPHTPTLPLPPPIEKGTFELACDTHGIPISLFISEWRASFWNGGSGGIIRGALMGAAIWFGMGVGNGWRANGNGWTRRWKCELRPSGHPDVMRKGMLELLFEHSPAGEEARLFTLCLGLLSLALWCIVWRSSVLSLVDTGVMA